MSGVTRRHGGQINPEHITGALLTIPGVGNIDKTELARTLIAITHRGIDDTIGNEATRYEKVCYVVAVGAAMTLLALKELDETEQADT